MLTDAELIAEYISTHEITREPPRDPHQAAIDELKQAGHQVVRARSTGPVQYLVDDSTWRVRVRQLYLWANALRRARGDEPLRRP